MKLQAVAWRFSPVNLVAWPASQDTSTLRCDHALAVLCHACLLLFARQHVMIVHFRSNET